MPLVILEYSAGPFLKNGDLIKFTLKYIDVSKCLLLNGLLK